MSLDQRLANYVCFQDVLYIARQRHEVNLIGKLLASDQIVGLRGVGKSAQLGAYAKAYPRDTSPGRTRRPTLQVDIPSTPSARHLWTALLKVVGDRIPGIHDLMKLQLEKRP